MKKTLLIAAAALAAGIITSQAQGPVYSQNIVGYVNTPIPASFKAIENPLNLVTVNGTNVASDVMPSLPDLTTVYIWNGASYNIYLVFGGQYYDQTGDNLLPTPKVNPGQAIFVNSPSAVTNTFVGSVSFAAGTTNSLALVAGFNFVGSPLPVGGGITTSLKVIPPDLTTLYTWNGASFNINLFFAGDWYDQTGDNLVPEPTVKVGEGFFLNLPSSYTWKQTF